MAEVHGMFNDYDEVSKILEVPCPLSVLFYYILVHYLAMDGMRVRLEALSGWYGVR